MSSHNPLQFCRFRLFDALTTTGDACVVHQDADGAMVRLDGGNHLCILIKVVDRGRIGLSLAASCHNGGHGFFGCLTVPSIIYCHGSAICGQGHGNTPANTSATACYKGHSPC